MKQIEFGILLSYITTFLKAVSMFIYIPILLSNIGVSEFGVFQLMGSFIAYFYILELGISSAITRYYTKFEVLRDTISKENLLWFSRLIYLLISLFVLIVGIITLYSFESIFVNFTNEELVSSKSIFILLIINLIFSFLSNTYNSVIISHERFIFLKLISLVQVILQAILIVSISYILPTAFYTSLVITITNLVVFTTKYIYFKSNKFSKIKYHFFDLKFIKNLVLFSFGLTIVSIIDQLFWRSNIILLGILSDTSILTIYSISSTIYLNYMQISTIIQSVFLPRVTRIITLSNNTKVISDFFTKVGRIQYLVMSLFLFGFALYGMEFIRFWLGNDYSQVYSLTLIIIVPFTIDLIQNISHPIIQVYGKYHYRAALMVIVLLFHIILSYFLYDFFGVYGVTFSISINILILNILLNFYYKYYLNINIEFFWKNILSLFIPGILIFSIFYFLKNIFPIINITTLLLQITFFSLVYVIALYYFKINSYEKKIILGIFNVFFKK